MNFSFGKEKTKTQSVKTDVLKFYLQICTKILSLFLKCVDPPIGPQ